MPTSIREKILDAICTAAAGKYGEFPQDDRDLPATRVIDGDDVARRNYDDSVLTMPVAVVRMNTATSNNADIMRAEAGGLYAAVVQEMFEDPTFDGLVDDLEHTGGGPGADNKFIFGIAQFQVTYHHLEGDPFNQ